MLAAVYAALRPLDRLRTRLLRAVGPLARVLVVDRELRVAVQGVALVAVSLMFTATMPLWMLALSPILLGVPHLLADLRYCVARPGLHRRAEWVVAVGAPLGALVFGADLWVGMLAVPGAFLASHGASWRKILGALAGIGLVWATSLNNRLATLILAHAHNFVAVALWWAWRPRGRRLHLLPLGAFLLASVALGMGWMDGVLAASASLLPGLGVTDHLRVLARGVEPTLGIRLVLLYAFAQSVHYWMWLRMVPDEDRDRVAPRTFRRSWDALVADVGPVVLWGAILSTAGLAVWAVIDLAQARYEYLHFARFHGVLELAAAAYFLVEGRPGAREDSQ
ncbi:MAG: hypothetical protein KDA24_15815 [Deltaproteobacteria bacterium]|nr:hypothetical protein [Deltaproteobacteria bacterium]